MNTIELYPHKQGCSQGCSHCGFSYKQDGTKLTNTTNDQTMNSLNILNEFNNAFDIQSALTYSFPLNGIIKESIPKLENIISLSLHSGANTINELNNHGSIFEIIDTLCSGYKDNRIGDQLQIDIAPKKLLLDLGELDQILEIGGKIITYSQQRGYDYSGLSITHNNEDISHLKNKKNDLDNESSRLEGRIKSIGDTILTKEYGNIAGENLQYYNYEILTKKFGVSKRVIALTKSTVTDINESFGRGNYRISLFPHGVMIDHATHLINNRHLRMKHSEFQELIKNQLSKKYNPVDILKSIKKGRNNYQFLYDRIIDRTKKDL